MMRSFAMATLVALGVAAPVAAQSDDVLFGVRAGVVDLDCFESDATGCVEADLSPSAGAFLDYGLASSLWGGLYVDVHGVTGDFDGREYMLDAGATLKTRIGDRSRRAYVRPGIGVGYGTIDIGESAQFLTTRATVEVNVPQAGGLSWMFEGGLYWAPMGSIDDSDAEFGPGFILRAGVLF